MDGVDAALVRFTPQPQLLEALVLPYPSPLRLRLQRLADPNDPVNLRELGQIDVEVGRHFAVAAESVLRQAGVQPHEVRAIGSHGQTVAHYPDDRFPSSLQIGDPNVIAETTGIETVADFRRRDLALGGQGAPLVPAFHQAVLRHPTETRVIANIGGMANITVLDGSQRPSPAFDTGPGNALLDAWHERHRQQAWDEDGCWSASGTVIESLLEAALAEPYFQRPPPKSTGREYFNEHWIDALLRHSGHPGAAPQDVQATLCQLTAVTIAAAATNQAPDAARLIVCGGGVHNRDLMTRLSQRLAPLAVQSSAEFGIDPDWMEAMAFAWLAARRLAHLPGNLPSATGARQAAVLGAIYPGRASP